MNGSRIAKFLGSFGFYHPAFATFWPFVRDYTVYFAGAIAIGLGNFILVPFYTRSLTTHEFGVYAIVDVTILLLVLVTQLGFGVSYLKWFANAEVSQRGELLGSTLAVSILLALFGGFGLAAWVHVAGTQWLQISHVSFAWMLLPIVLCENIQGLLLNDLRARQKATLYASAAVIRLLTIVIASIWCISVWEMSLAGVFLGRLIGDAVGVVFLSIMCLRTVQLQFSLKLARTMVRYGIPLVWGGLVALLMDAAGRYFLNYYGSIEQVGFYGTAVKISSIFQILITQPFGLAWGGIMFRIAKRPDARAIYSRIIAYVVLIPCIVAFILSILSPVLLAIFATSEYAPALLVLPMIFFVRAVNLLEYPTSLGIHLKGEARIFMVIYTIGLIACVIANIILVPAYGMMGAACSWLIGWFTIVLTMALIGQYFYPLQYNWWLLGLPMILWLIFSIVLSSGVIDIAALNWVARVIIVMIAVIGTVVLVWHDLRSMYRTSRLEALQ